MKFMFLLKFPLSNLIIRITSKILKIIYANKKFSQALTMKEMNPKKPKGLFE